MQALVRTLILGIGLFVALPLQAQRVSLDLASDWKFIKQDVAPDAPIASWENVSIPHTWNNLDGQDGKAAEPQFPDGYYRGPGWYARVLPILPAWKTKRIFIRFEAAATVAQVYCNGHLLGEHRGNFTAFCFELTRYLHFDSPNELRVRVDNSRTTDVPPLDGDFDIMGGLYRPVHLIVTDPVCVTPLDFASPGVYLTTSLSPTAATVNVKSVVSNGTKSAVSVVVSVQIRNASQQIVATAEQVLPLAPGQTQPLTLAVHISQPHLWNGRKDPYLYSVEVHVSASPGGSDSVTQMLGLRTVAITNKQGFLLNGQPYPIHGVNLHQDRRDEGWAMSNADHDQDLKQMLDMGVTAVRLAHYPQSDYLHDQCDRNGLLLWDEIPLVNLISDTPAFRANASQQLREMILQRYNHSSVAFWGMCNELDQKYDTSAMPLLEGLKAEAKQLDPSRLNVAATRVSKAGFNSVPDWICFNPYFGWYSGMPGELTGYLDGRYRANGNKRIGISEYGAGGNPAQHEGEPLTKPFPGGPFHPEEWECLVHEQNWSQIKNNPELWGSFIWVMYDFASDHRDEGATPGVNDKGMVTADRKTKKDVYYFYQANWTDAPMLHLTDSGFVDRTTSPIEVKAYSNCQKVELKVNGKSLGVVEPDDLHICRWTNVQLQPGSNAIEARAPDAPLSDTCNWTYTPAKLEPQQLVPNVKPPSSQPTNPRSRG